MLIWADFDINKVYAKVDEDNKNNNMLSFGAKFAIITLKEQGWIHDDQLNTCYKTFENKNELKIILKKIEVPQVGIQEIIIEAES